MFGISFRAMLIQGESGEPTGEWSRNNGAKDGRAKTRKDGGRKTNVKSGHHIPKRFVLFGSEKTALDQGAKSTELELTRVDHSSVHSVWAHDPLSQEKES